MFEVPQELRCFAERHGDGWWASCVDFDLAVQGSSFGEVRDGLRTAIDLYLERIEALPEVEQRVFLRRCAPLRVRARYFAAVVRARL